MTGAKLKSLVFRELKMNRKYFTLNMLVLIAYSALLIIVSLVMKMSLIPEMAESGEKAPEEFLSAMTGICSTVILFLATAFISIDNILSSDIKAGWLKYSYTLPISPAERAAAVIARSALTNFVLSVIGITAVLLINAVCGTGFGVKFIVIYFIFLDFSVAAAIISDFVLLRSRTSEEIKNKSLFSYALNVSVKIVLTVLLLKAFGINFDVLFSETDASLFPADPFTLMTAEKLILLIPLTLLLIAAHYGIIKIRLQNAVGTATKKSAKSKESADDKSEITAPHSEPAGFLYKELKQNKRNIICVIALPFFMVFMMPVFIALSLLTTEEAGSFVSVVETLTSDIFRLIMIFAGMLISGLFMLETFHGDDRKLWAYFAVSTPDGLNRYMYTKYALSFAMFGLYFVSSYFAENILATLRWFVLGDEMTSFAALSLAIFYYMLLKNAFSIPIMVRFGEKKSTVINLIIIAVFAIAALIIILPSPEETLTAAKEFLLTAIKGENAGDVFMLCAGITPFICIGAYLISYKVSCRLFMKGVDGYVRWEKA